LINRLNLKPVCFNDAVLLLWLFFSLPLFLVLLCMQFSMCLIDFS